MMKIQWYGQASCLVTADDGRKVITDPYTPETAGYRPITDEPNVVIISSDNDSFHCRADLIPGNPTVINALELAMSGQERTESGITFKAIAAMEALNHREHDPDQNGMYRFTVDGVSVGHMGDIGNALSEQQMEFFKGVDVLLALAGGHPVIELDDLKVAIDKIQPRYVIPIHFRTLVYKPRNQFWIANFLNYFDDKDVDLACSYEVILHKDSLPEKTRVMLLGHSQ
jgi:L-ascorbate metabolism protein UlaG (beta-lactamase superfamily)